MIVTDPLRRGPMPLWFQIKERLRSSIVTGVLSPGDQVPTEHRLMAMYSVSRTTVRAALQALVHEGLIERTPGRGSFVAQLRVNQPATQLAGFHEDMRDRGLVPSTHTTRVELVAPGPETSSRLGVEGGRAVVLERLLLADEEPIAFQRSLIPEWVLGGGDLFDPGDLDSKSLYDLMDDRSGSRPRSAEQSIEATLAESDVGSLLQVQTGAPLLRVERLCLDRFDSPVEWVELWYRADRYTFRVALQRSSDEWGRDPHE